MKDYYDALGVPRNAGASVIKIAFEGKVKRLASLPEAERAAEKKALDEAYVILSNPSKRDWYDRKLDEHHATSDRRGSGVKKPAAILAVAAIAIAGTAYYFTERARERERVRLEEQRIALERERARRQAEIEEARLKEQQASREQAMEYRKERDARHQAERERAQWDRDVRAQESRMQYDAARAKSQAQTEQRQQQYDEQRQRAQAEAERRKAQAEVDRQNRWVAEREREEERARQQRYNKILYEDTLKKGATKP